MNKQEVILKFYPPLIYKVIGGGLLFLGLINLLIQDGIFFFIWFFFTSTWIVYSFGMSRVVKLGEANVDCYYTVFKRVSLLKKKYSFDIYEFGCVLLEEYPPIESDVLSPSYFILLEKSGEASFKIRIPGDKNTILKKLSVLKSKGIPFTTESR